MTYSKKFARSKLKVGNILELKNIPIKKVKLKAMKMGIPPKRDTGFLWIFLSEGKSRLFSFLATRQTKGVMISAIAADMEKKKRYLVIKYYNFPFLVILKNYPIE